MRIALSVAPDHPVFAGHFPGRPMVPGALLLDLARLASARVLGVRVTGVAAAKFHSPLLPGEALELELDAARFTLWSGERTIASGRWVVEQAT